MRILFYNTIIKRKMQLYEFFIRKNMKIIKAWKNNFCLFLRN